MHDPRDDFKVANVEVVERKTRVLLLAGGPTREYAFLPQPAVPRPRHDRRTCCCRPASRGSRRNRTSCCSSSRKRREELFEYDCIVAFDPDWTALDLIQVKNLEQWVADKAGGLIVVAGPVHTPQWSSARRGDSRLDTIRNLYPVVLYSSGSATLGVGRFGGENPWPLQFTREGLEAEFLWLEDDAVQQRGGLGLVRRRLRLLRRQGSQAGARVYARFSDPSTAIDGQLPIYMASHFYGAGRVFFQASGEMWRIRAVDEAYFERYYTKLIRWVSQGRLQQDSTHGVLLVDKERALLGDTIGMQAILTDDQNRPLSVPEVTANLVRPDGGRSPLHAAAGQGRRARGHVRRPVHRRAGRRLPRGAAAAARATGRIAGPRGPGPRAGVGNGEVGTERSAAVGDRAERPAARTTSAWMRPRPGGGGSPLASALQAQDFVYVPARHAGPRFRAAADGLVDGGDLRRAVPGVAGAAIEQIGVKKRERGRESFGPADRVFVQRPLASQETSPTRCPRPPGRRFEHHSLR